MRKPSLWTLGLALMLYCAPHASADDLPASTPPSAAAPVAAEPVADAPKPSAQPVMSSPATTPNTGDPLAAAQAEAAPTAATLFAQLDDNSIEASSSDEPHPVQLYGFADIGYRHFFVDKDNPWLLFLNRHPSFFVGNLNMYLDAQLSSRWRSLFEIRFTYLPNGAPITDLEDSTIGRESSRTADYNDFTRSKSLGSIMIERAMVEYSAFEWLSFKAGQWLTPYGIWNVDHGSPVIVGVSRPFIIGAELLPEHQVGLMADGSVALAPDLELSYMIGLSNGRIDAVAYEDLDGNKAITARAALTLTHLGRLTLGSTFYMGRYTESVNELVLKGTTPKSRENVLLQFDEVSYAFDLQWRYDSLQLQSEWIINDRAFTDRGRPPAANGGLRADKRNWGGYGLVGYRTPWLTIMPYVKAEYSPEPQSQSIGVADQIVIYTFGLNVRPLPNVVFKAEYAYAYFPEGDPKSFAGSALHGMDLQLAVSY